MVPDRAGRWAPGVGVVLASLASPLWRLAGYAILAAGLFGAGAYWMHGRATAKYDRLNAEYNQFKGGVEMAGRLAKVAADKQALADRQAKEKADEENRTALAAANARIAKLRALAAQRNSRGGSVSAAPAGSHCPDGQVCFDRAEYQRAVGEFDSGARRLADEGAKVTVDLNTAREWANRRTP